MKKVLVAFMTFRQAQRLCRRRSLSLAAASPGLELKQKGCSDLVTNSTTTIECVSFSGVFTVAHCFVLKFPIAGSRTAQS